MTVEEKLKQAEERVAMLRVYLKEILKVAEARNWQGLSLAEIETIKAVRALLSETKKKTRVAPTDIHPKEHALA